MPSTSDTTTDSTSKTKSKTSSEEVETIDTSDTEKVYEEHVKDTKEILKKLIADEIEERYEEETTGYGRNLLSFITDLQFNENGSEADLSGFGKLLEEDNQLTFNTMLRSQILEEVIKTAGLIPVVDFTDLQDDVISWTSKSSSGSSNASASGDGSMTESQAWEIAQSFVYGGCGTGHDPVKAWQIIGTTKGHTADCYDATAWLYYVYNYKIGIAARDVCNTGTGDSGSHHWMQYQKNGQWQDPGEYSGMTRNLKIIHNRSSADHICRAPGGTASSPPSYSCCPYSHNGSC